MKRTMDSLDILYYPENSGSIKPLFRFRNDRQADPKGSPLLRQALHRYASAMVVNNIVADHQAKARSRILRRIEGLPEHLQLVPNGISSFTNQPFSKNAGEEVFPQEAGKRMWREGGELQLCSYFAKTRLFRSIKCNCAVKIACFTIIYEVA